LYFCDYSTDQSVVLYPGLPPVILSPIPQHCKISDEARLSSFFLAVKASFGCALQMQTQREIGSSADGNGDADS
jgi:hypothetical protein